MSRDLKGDPNRIWDGTWRVEKPADFDGNPRTITGRAARNILVQGAGRLTEWEAWCCQRAVYSPCPTDTHRRWIDAIGYRLTGRLAA